MRILLSMLLFMIFIVGCATIPTIDEQKLQGPLDELWAYADSVEKNGSYAQERMVLEEIISRIPNHNFAFFRIEKSWFHEAQKDSQREKYQKVEKTFGDFFDSFSVGQNPWEHPNMEEALWILARSYCEQMSPPDRGQKETKECINVIEEKLFTHYPNTLYHDIAEKLLYKARRNLARHAFFIGDFYLRTWALTSAELRFKSMLEEYSGLGLDDEIRARLEEIDRLKNNPTRLEKTKRLLFFQMTDQDLDTAKETQEKRVEEQRGDR